MNATRPDILFIQGAWHTQAPYVDFIAKLEDRGYRVIAPLLPSAAPETPSDPPESDIALFRRLAVDLADQGREFVVVAHSYGGTIATEAMANLGVATRKEQGRPGGATHMVYVAAFMLPVGVSLEDLSSTDNLEWCHYEDGLKVFTPGVDIGAVFYPDLPAEEQERQLKLAEGVKHPQACSLYRVTQAAYKNIPTTVVLCELDNAFPYAGQKAMLDSHKNAGVSLNEVTLSSGHFPTLSTAGKLVDIVESCCQQPDAITASTEDSTKL
ncbi:Alpha/Beta hydrolase protein [Xylariales sp. PMI_506]|nr:Alpha/Beta hydrolase protein [Xylariales sp. PMI_506]